MNLKRYFLVILSLSTYALGFAQTHIWVGGTNDSNWHNAANWNTNTVPTSTSDVLN